MKNFLISSFIIIPLFLFISFVPSFGESPLFPSGLIGAYFFDEGIGSITSDSSGNGLDGTLLNGPVWTSGYDGQGLEFDGIDDYVYMTSSIYTLTGGTLSLWFKKTGDGSGEDVIIGSVGGSGSSRAPTLYVPSSTLLWEFGSLVMQDSGQPIINDRWYHVAMTYDDNFNVSLYLDGVLVDSGTSANPQEFYEQVHIGHYGGWGNHFFQGVVDEVLIWDRPLSQEEVAQVFNAITPDPDTTPPSIPQSLSAIDISGNNVSLVWSGSTDPESGIAHYNIYRDGDILAGQTSAAFFSDSSVAPNQTYIYEVTAVNGEGLESLRSASVDVSTPTDLVPPLISNTTVSNVTSTSATITWNTDEPSISRIEYGIGTYDISEEDLVFKTTHSMTLEYLDPDTLYHFILIASDSSGNTATTEENSFSTHDTISLPSGLIGAYFFDEGIGSITSDSSGNGLDGTLLNGPVWTSGYDGQGLEFDGIDDYVYMTSSIYTLTGGTLSLWFKKTGDGSGEDVIIGSVGGSGSSRAPTLYVPSSTLLWEFGSLVMQDSGQPIINDRWYHVAMTYDDNFNVSLYLDGVLVDSGTSANPQEFYEQVHIGHYGGWGNHFFQGVVDEVLIWDRPLSQEEVAQVFNAITPDPDTTPPSIPQSLSAIDISGNNVSLVWSGSTDPESGIAHYNIYRDGDILAGQTSAAFFSDSSVAPNQTYIYEVTAVNGEGLESLRSASVDVSTPTDLVPPLISNTTVSNVTSTSATITWNTDEPSISRIEYGIGTYDISEEDLVFKTTHSMTLEYLDPDTLYHFILIASDSSGNTATTEENSFATTQLLQPPGIIPGGPILIISSITNPFAYYYSEILRAEGLNLFDVRDISEISLPIMQEYDIAILGEIPLSTDHIEMLTNWVYGGGNLITMRPDKKLANLLGLSATEATISEGYMLIDTSKNPGHGIVDSTIQFHGTADLYTISDAIAVASLYSDAENPIQNPAVTLREFSENGGNVAAFTFDLARSIVYTRQGNPEWVGQKRTGETTHPLGSVDLFYGASVSDPQIDWVNRDKISIPQADEQQRLLVNLIMYMNFNNKPIPRFWYFPRGEKAVIIMTGDDHGNGGTIGRFDQYMEYSPDGCVVEDWECIRSSSYIYPWTPISDEQAAEYTATGFEIGIHLNTQCSDWSLSMLDNYYTNQLDELISSFPSLPNPSSVRTHCVAWSDYASHAIINKKFNVRLDTNYYYWPDFWVSDSPGFFTGSGIPMRFSNVDGTLIDVYQATTQMTDQSGQNYPFTIDSLLSKALGSEGYYGAFTVNAHTDWVDSGISDLIIASALSHGVPVISGRQMLKWLDGRENSSFRSIEMVHDRLGFTIVKGDNSNGLQVILPVNSKMGRLSSVYYESNPINFTTEQIKGVEYGIFQIDNGHYEAVYEIDTTPPVISGLNVSSITSNSATISWSTNEPSTGSIEYGNEIGVYEEIAHSSQTLSNVHSVFLSGIESNTTYHFIVNAADISGNFYVSDDLTFSTHDTISLPSGLIGAYFFDEGIGSITSDSSGNGLDGTLLNGPVWTSGYDGQGLEFDGIDDYVYMTSSIYTLTGGTLSLWFKKTGDGSGEDVIIGSVGGSGSSRAPTLYVPSSTLLWEFGSLVMQDSGQPIINDRWYHVAMTYDDNFNVSLYLDGVLVDSGTSANPQEFYEQVHIGHYGGWGNHFFQGVVDEVLIWDRPLSNQELFELGNR